MIFYLVHAESWWTMRHESAMAILSEFRFHPENRPTQYDFFCSLPLDPKTMKNEGFKPPNIWVQSPLKMKETWVPMVQAILWPSRQVLVCPDVGCGVFGNDPEAQIFPMRLPKASGLKKTPASSGVFYGPLTDFKFFFVGFKGLKVIWKKRISEKNNSRWITNPYPFMVMVYLPIATITNHPNVGK